MLSEPNSKATSFLQLRKLRLKEVSNLLRTSPAVSYEPQFGVGQAGLAVLVCPLHSPCSARRREPLGKGLVSPSSQKSLGYSGRKSGQGTSILVTGNSLGKDLGV